MNVDPTTLTQWARRVEGRRRLSARARRFRRQLSRATVTDPAAFVEAVESHDPWVIAAKIHRETGYWPISLSWPRTESPVGCIGSRGRLLAPQIPGLPYEYGSETRYYEDYANSEMALTWKKGGWDCFRHIEIIASGCLPLMPDSGAIPVGTMVHYPKELLTKVADSLTGLQARPDVGLRTPLREYFENHLTSSAMARYMIRAVGFDRDRSPLPRFVDRSLPEIPDYLSIMTLVGWLEHGPLRVSEVPDYLKADWYPTRPIYGRGFGYSRSIDSDTRSGNVIEEDANLASNDRSNWIIVGSARRNLEVLQSLARIGFPRHRLILVDGEDSPPDAATLDMYASVSQHIFIRELQV